MEIKNSSATPQRRKQGKVVVNGDEWTLSDTGFENAPAASVFLRNVANWFADGQAGKFLLYSTNWGFNQTLFGATLKAGGHHLTANINATFTTEALLAYDGVFVCGNIASNEVLLDYVKSGGCVYLGAGTGAAGTAAAEAAMWKPFLNALGFQLGDEWDGERGNFSPLSAHAITTGVKDLFFNNANPVRDIDQSPASQIVINNSKGQGVLGWFDAALLPQQVVISDIFFDGKVKMVESDEVIEISNLGFSHVDISNWLVNAGHSKQDFRFPQGTRLRSGQNVRIYTNEIHSETGGFSFGSKTAIWNNQGDAGYLSDSDGIEIASKHYTVEKSAAKK